MTNPRKVEHRPYKNTQSFHTVSIRAGMTGIGDFKKVLHQPASGRRFCVSEFFKSDVLYY
jgi:hypothetical protein